MKVILVVDMQNDFITGVFGTPEAQAIVPKIKDYLDKFKNDVHAVRIFTQDTHCNKPEHELARTLEEKMLPSHCIECSKGWHIVDELKDYAEYEIDKRNFGTFDLSELCSEVLDNVYTAFETIESIEIMGLCTDICVISNALILRAQFPYIPITVHADLCAGTTPEKHEAALKVMESCLINIVREEKI